MLMTIFIVQLIGLISPGPDFFYISRKAASDSTRNAICACIGISIGVAIWAVVAVFGLSVLSQTTHIIQYIIMILGGSFLAYMGVKMAQVTQNAKFDESKAKVVQTTIRQEILKALSVNIANAKIAVFFSSVLSGYVAQLSNMTDLLAVLLILVGSAFVYFLLVSLLFSRKPIRNFYTKYSRYIDNVAGVIFIVFGMILIFDGIKGLIG